MQTITQSKNSNTQFFFKQHHLLYQQFIQSITYCEAYIIELPMQIESCFSAVVGFLHTLVKEISLHSFRSRDEETLFFKKIQPLFTVQHQYYKLLCTVRLHTNTSQKAITDRKLWLKQVQILSVFKQKNAAFIQAVAGNAAGN